MVLMTTHFERPSPRSGGNGLAGTDTVSASARRLPRPLLRLVISLCLFASGVSACTIGAFGPSATNDGHPLLWKNRDSDTVNQELGVFQGPAHRFVALINAGDTLNAWAGINEAGFGIMNSTSFNLGTACDRDPDDGRVMFAALGRCATVAEFAKLMDSLNRVGRVTDANYGVLDSTGMASVFEARSRRYVRFDCADDRLGLLLRANYSMSGGPDYRVGFNRQRRARQLVMHALRHDSINARFAVQVLARDLGQVGFDPYPLPYRESLAGLPFGFVPSETTICRTLTRAAAVVVGARPGEPASTAMMWVMLGPTEASIPVPVWAAAESMPVLLNGPEHSILCDEALAINGCLHAPPSCPGGLNTFRLAEMYDSFASTEAAVFELVADQRATQGRFGPSPRETEDLTRLAARMVEKAYVAFWRYIRWNEAAASRRELGEARPDGSAATAGQVPLSGSRRAPTRVYDITGREVAAAYCGSAEVPLGASPGQKPGVYFSVPEPGSAPVRFLVTRGQ